MKTLKDIDVSDVNTNNSEDFLVGELSIKMTLKQSAIDDIKELNKKIKNDKSLDNYKQFEFEAIIDYIMDKFNITDDDLREVT